MAKTSTLLDTVTSTDLLAPGEGIQVTGLGDFPSIDGGTSYAAPHVTASVALLQQYANERITSGNLRWDSTKSRRHETYKAVLLNSADKIAGVHGSTRTIVDKGGLDWLASEALTGFDADQIPLDDEMGAGHLNVGRAVQQYSSGEYDSDGAPVPVIAWDYGHTSGLDDINKYVFAQPLLGGSYVAITLAYDRQVEFDIDDGTADFYDIGDTFLPYTETTPIADDVINDLDLYLLPKDSTDFAEAIAVSLSPDSTIDHIFAEIPTTGEYEFWVHQWDNDLGNGQDYAVAWWAVSAAPNPPGDYSGNGTVGPEDYGVWTADFGTTDPAADGTGDGIVDAADYVIWRHNLVEGGGSFALAPEPSGMMLFVVASILTGGLRRARCV